MLVRLAWACALASLVVGAPAPALVAQSADKSASPDLSGTWQLDPERDHAAGRPNAFATGGAPGRGGRGGGGGGAGGAGGGTGISGWGEGGGGELAPPSPEELARARTVMQMAQRPPALLAIGQSGAEVSFTVDGSVRRVSATNKKETLQSEIGKLSRKARWKDALLVIETDFEGNFRLTEAYELSADAKELHLSMTFLNGRAPQPRVFHHYYVRALAQ
jgi:hypothetical protein